ncbi:MAG: hypothetical protein AB1578_16385 [Thermodesulfobacteriota bacterium]|jgi:hypothetical protein
MDQTEAELVIEWFIDLESRLRGYLRTVPINWNHNATLPLLAGIVLEAGGLVDSIFRMEFNPSDCRSKRKNLNITHFATQYERRYSLSRKSSIIYQYPPVLLAPFYTWTIQKQNGAIDLDWWDAYNKLKHERIEQYAQCTLANAVKSLCALHQMLAVLPCFFRSLIAHDMVALRGYAIPYAIDSVEQGAVDMPFLVESDLFATPFGEQCFPADLNQVSGAIYGGSRRLEQFLGR